MAYDRNLEKRVQNTPWLSHLLLSQIRFFCVTFQDKLQYWLVTGFYVLQHGWYMQNNSVTALFNMLATSRSCGNIYCFDQNYQPVTFQDSVLIIKYLVAVSFRSYNMCCIFGFNCFLEEIKIDKSGMDKERAANSG